MFGKSEKKSDTQPVKKPTPAFLRDDYPYKAVGEPITDINLLEDTGVLYEIKCPKCEMSIRSQGKNIKATYNKLLNGLEVKNEDGTTRIDGGKGCLGCGNRELVVKLVDMGKQA